MKQERSVEELNQIFNSSLMEAFLLAGISSVIEIVRMISEKNRIPADPHLQLVIILTAISSGSLSVRAFLANNQIKKR